MNYQALNCNATPWELVTLNLQHGKVWFFCNIARNIPVDQCEMLRNTYSLFTNLTYVYFMILCRGKSSGTIPPDWQSI